MENNFHVNAHIKIPSRGCQWMQYIEKMENANFYGALNGEQG